MARTPTPRPIGEHLATVARMMRQIRAATTLPKKRVARILKHLGGVMNELTREINDRERRSEE